MKMKTALMNGKMNRFPKLEKNDILLSGNTIKVDDEEIAATLDLLYLISKKLKNRKKTL